MKPFITTLLALFIWTVTTAQNNIGVGTLTPNAKALMDLTATDKGFLIPRMTTVQRTAIAPVGAVDAGLLVYDTDDNLFYYWDSNTWKPIPLQGLSGLNITLGFDSTTNILSISDDGGTLTTLLNLNVDDDDSDPTNEIQVISRLNDTLYLSNGGFAVLPPDNVNDADSDPTNEIQTLSIAGRDVTISQGNTITLPPDNVNDADSNPSNELQNLTINQSGTTVNWSLNNGGGSGSFQTVDNDWNVIGNRMHSIPTGNVGIGVTNPNAKLDVIGNSEIDGELAMIQGTANKVIIFNRGNGNSANLSDILFDQRGLIAAHYHMFFNIDSDNNDTDGKFYFKKDTEDDSGTDLMVIQENGNVGIGVSNPVFRLQVNGTAAKPGGGNWAAASDRRLKQNVRPYTDGLEEVLAIEPVTFKYNEQSGYDTKPEYVGVIAQDLKEVTPYMVTTFEGGNPDNEQTYFSVDNSAMTYMLVNAVKELNQEKIDQRTEIDALKNELQALKEILKEARH